MTPIPVSQCDLHTLSQRLVSGGHSHSYYAILAAVAPHNPATRAEGWRAYSGGTLGKMTVWKPGLRGGYGREIKHGHASLQAGSAPAEAAGGHWRAARGRGACAEQGHPTRHRAAVSAHASCSLPSGVVPVEPSAHDHYR